MKSHQLLGAIILCIATITIAGPATAPVEPVDDESLVTNGDFERGVDGWISKDNGMSQVKPAIHSHIMGSRSNSLHVENLPGIIIYPTKHHDCQFIAMLLNR